MAVQAQRADRILDAAADLILRWGYDKTTIDDIARAAGVAKGTIYLHWTSREALFLALLRRERISMLAQTRAVLVDAGHPTLRGLLSQVTLAILRRPLLQAIIVRDLQVLGKLAHREQRPDPRERPRWRAGFASYLDDLRTHGLVRTDQSLAAQVHGVSAIFLGSLVVTPLMPAEYALSDAERADLVAEAVERLLDRGRRLTAAETRRFGRITLDLLDGIIAGPPDPAGTDNQ
jgi:AcrR family transcriptional regulator